MSLSFSVLGSGSSGNSTLLVLGEPGGARHALIDCGLSPRRTKARLGPLGLSLEDVSDVLLTHLDGDHFAPGWPRRIRELGITAHVHVRHRRLAARLGLDGRHMHVFRRSFRLESGAAIDPVLLAHDELGTVGFVVELGGTRLGFATDLGRVTASLRRRFVDLHALAIESNYDPDLERASPRPASLKQRIMGGLGHLSNEQSIRAVLEIDRCSRLAHVVPLHLSRQCNDPRLVKRLYAEHAPHLLDRLTIPSPHAPTALLHVGEGGASSAPGQPGAQLAMWS